MTGQPNYIPEPLVPEDVDLTGYPFTPLFRARLFGSRFNAKATDSEWRAGVTLWLKSWDQFPAGTLPDDDDELAYLAAVPLDRWKAIKGMAMHGWVLCQDGRLHHAVVAEGILEAWAARKKAIERGAAGAAKRWGRKVKSQNRQSNGASNAPAIEQASSKHSNGEGQGEGKKVTPAPSGAAFEGPSSPDDKTWVFNEGAHAIAQLTSKPIARAKSLVGKWLKDLSENAGQLRGIIEDTAIKKPGDPVSWITASVQARKGGAPQPPDEAEAIWKWRLKMYGFRRHGMWAHDAGDPPGHKYFNGPKSILAEWPPGVPAGGWRMPEKTDPPPAGWPE